MAKRIQGLPPNTANLAVLPTLGWWSMRSVIDYKRLVMLWHILSLPMSSIYKLVTMTLFLWLDAAPDKRISYNGPAGVLYRVCSEYGLRNFVMNALVSGMFISMGEWKLKVKSIIWNREKQIFLSMTRMYKCGNLYAQCIHYGELWSWWRFCKYKPAYVNKCFVILRLATGNHVIRERRNKQYSSRMCQECNAMVDDTVHHMLFECSGLSQIRDITWNNVLTAAPRALANDLNNMSSERKTILLLSGFGQFIQEWSNMYIVACNFLYEMHHVKKQQVLNNSL